MMTMMRTRVLPCVCTLLGLMLLSAPMAYGGKVYKWVIDGRIVYMDKKPSSDKGTVEEKRVDDERNVVHMTPAGTEVSSGGSRNKGPRRSAKATNKKPTTAQNQTGKNVAGTTTGQESNVPTSHNLPTDHNLPTHHNLPTSRNAQTGSSFVRGRGGASAGSGPGATPGPGF